MSRRKWLAGFGVVLAAGALAIPAFGAGKGPRHKNVKFTATAVGASIGNDEAVYKVKDSVFGAGAAVQKTTMSSATGGAGTTVAFYGIGTARSKDTYTLGQPDANGVIPITGQGNDVGGTGKLKHLRSTYTFTGTFDPKTNIVSVTLKGTYSY